MSFTLKGGVYKVENNDLQINDETYKADNELNVNPDLPDTGKPTSSSDGSTEPSGDSSMNMQEAVQKHAELRKKAEEEADKAKKEAEAAMKLAAENAQEANRLKKEKVESSIRNAIDKSRLPDGYKANRIGKDPIKWFFAHASDVPEKLTWDEAEKLVQEQLGVLVSGLEQDLHVAGENTPQNPREIFTDPDNAPVQGQEVKSQGDLTMGDISKMSPYEINSLPDEIKNQLAQAGNKIEL